MAETKYLTQEQADELIGKVGLVVHPSKGEQGPPGGWKCTGYALDHDGTDKVVSLELESAAQTGDIPVHGEIKDPKTGDRRLGVVNTIPSHPVETRPACNPRWFRPAREILDAKPAAEAAETSEAAKPATPAKPVAAK